MRWWLHNQIECNMAVLFCCGLKSFRTNINSGREQLLFTCSLSSHFLFSHVSRLLCDPFFSFFLKKCSPSIPFPFTLTCSLPTPLHFFHILAVFPHFLLSSIYSPCFSFSGSYSPWSFSSSSSWYLLYCSSSSPPLHPPLHSCWFGGFRVLMRRWIEKEEDGAVHVYINMKDMQWLATAFTSCSKLLAQQSYYHSHGTQLMCIYTLLLIPWNVVCLLEVKWLIVTDRTFYKYSYRWTWLW